MASNFMSTRIKVRMATTVIIDMLSEQIILLRYTLISFAAPKKEKNRDSVVISMIPSIRRSVGKIYLYGCNVQSILDDIMCYTHKYFSNALACILYIHNQHDRVD